MRGIVATATATSKGAISVVFMNFSFSSKRVRLGRRPLRLQHLPHFFRRDRDVDVRHAKVAQRIHHRIGDPPPPPHPPPPPPRLGPKRVAGGGGCSSCRSPNSVIRARSAPGNR